MKIVQSCCCLSFSPVILCYLWFVVLCPLYDFGWCWPLTALANLKPISIWPTGSIISEGMCCEDFKRLEVTLEPHRTKTSGSCSFLIILNGSRFHGHLILIYSPLHTAVTLYRHTEDIPLSQPPLFLHQTNKKRYMARSVQTHSERNQLLVRASVSAFKLKTFWWEKRLQASVLAWNRCVCMWKG